MAQEIVLRCDAPRCAKTATAWRIWPDGAPAAYRVDLCDTHAKPLRTLIEGAPSEPLPTKQRQGLQVTRLKTTKHTKALKR